MNLIKGQDVIDVRQSPTNSILWALTLRCGCIKWRTTTVKPRRKKVECEKHPVETADAERA